MKKYNGFSLRENKVILHYGITERKQDIEFFDTPEQAREFYNEVTNRNSKNPKRPMLKAIKQMFCQHDTNKLSGYNGENTFYEYCGNCGKSKYVDIRTEDEFIEQQAKNKKIFDGYDIRELRKQKFQMESDLLKLEEQIQNKESDFETKWGEKCK